VGLVTTRFKENAIIITSMWLMLIGLAGWAITPNLPVLLLIMLPLSLGGGMLNTVINSAITKAVDREEIGGTLGISTSLESVSRVIAPSAGGFLLENLGAWAPGVVSAGLMAWAVWFTYRRIILVKIPTDLSTSEAVNG
jgi:DHA1 family tetracycline resistance protein-like MFS transporter